MVHNYLYYPEYTLARQLVTSGAIGTLRHVTLNFLEMPDNPGAAEYRPQWRHDPGEAGLRSLEAVLAAYASGATGRAVLLPLSPNDPVYRRGVAGLKELPVWVDSPLRRRGVFGL